VLLFEQGPELLKEASIELLDSARNTGMLLLGDSWCTDAVWETYFTDVIALTLRKQVP
jgi:hypothetical protein